MKETRGRPRSKDEPKRKVNFAISLPIYAEIEKISEAEDRSIAYVIERIIRQHFAK